MSTDNGSVHESFANDLTFDTQLDNNIANGLIGWIDREEDNYND